MLLTEHTGHTWSAGVPRDASQQAAAAAHEVLLALYPAFQATLDAALQQSLAQIPDGSDKAEGIRVGQTVADGILALRSNDGSNAKPTPYVFGTPPGDYQSTPLNFPAQPQFTHWSRVTPFALERASQFRPGPPPALSSDTYGDAFNQIKSLGIVNSTTATADEALTGRFGMEPYRTIGRQFLAQRLRPSCLPFALAFRWRAFTRSTMEDGLYPGGCGHGVPKVREHTLERLRPEVMKRHDHNAVWFATHVYQRVVRSASVSH